jgi:hypothetical protein
MGVIPGLFGHSTAKAADGCQLCDETRATTDDVALAARQLHHVLPLALAAIAGVVLATIDRGPAGWLGAGVAAGIAACAVYVAYGRRTLVRSAHEAHAAELAAMAEDADSRVELVVKQFEWAVGDVGKLRNKLEHAEASALALTERVREREHQNEQLVRQISRLRERLAEIAMDASLTRAGREPTARPPMEAVYFSWGVHFDGPRARLELQTAATADSPTRLRVMDRDGQIVSVSGMAMVSLDGNLEFQLEPPLDLIVDLDERREINYAIEALVEQQWKPVRLRDSGRRTASVVDAQGRLSRAPEIRDTSHDGEQAVARRSTLN